MFKFMIIKTGQLQNDKINTGMGWNNWPGTDQNLKYYVYLPQSVVLSIHILEHFCCD